MAWDEGGKPYGGLSLANVAVGLSATQMSRVMETEWKRSQAQMTELQARNETLSAELQAVRERLSEVDTINAQFLTLTLAFDELKAELNQPERSSQLARTIK